LRPGYADANLFTDSSRIGVTETLIARKSDPSIGLRAPTVAQVHPAGVEGTAAGQTIDPRTFATGRRG